HSGLRLRVRIGASGRYCPSYLAAIGRGPRVSDSLACFCCFDGSCNPAAPNRNWCVPEELNLAPRHVEAVLNHSARDAALVRAERLELPCLATTASETVVSAVPPRARGALCRLCPCRLRPTKAALC